MSLANHVSQLHKLRNATEETPTSNNGNYVPLIPKIFANHHIKSTASLPSIYTKIDIDSSSLEGLPKKMINIHVPKI